MKNRKFIKLGILVLCLVTTCSLLFSCGQRAAPVSSGNVYTRTAWAKDFGPGQLDAHYLKHKSEFGDITKQEYLHGAKILLNSAAGKDILEKIRDNGDVLHYRVSTREFAVMAADGRIRTYFKADYRYWLKQ